MGQKHSKKKHNLINYHFQENAKRRKLFLYNDDDSDEDGYDLKANENNGYEFEASHTGIKTQSRFSPNGDSPSKTLFNRGCIGDLLYHKKPGSTNKKNISPKIKKRKYSVNTIPENEDADIEADVEDELDDADSVSSLVLSSKSSKLHQDLKQQLATNPENKYNSPKLVNHSSKETDKATLKSNFNAKTNDKNDTKENILNQKPRQPSNHHRNNSSSRIKTDINLKPVVKRAAASKASDKIAKDSAALNRSLDQPFSTSTSDASSGKEKKLYSRSNRNKNGNISFSSSSDSSDSEKEKPVAKQKRQTSFTNNRRTSKLKDSPKINSNTKKINASNQKQNLDNVLAPTA